MSDDRQSTLWLAIDARKAKAGSLEFERATNRVQSAAGIAKRAVVGLAGSISALFAVRRIYRDMTQFETGLVGVGKTADLSGEALQALGQEIIHLSTQIPIATTQLLSIAQAAGQLGVTGSENILLFTETVAKLGTASDLAGEEAATVLARMLNVTGEAVGSVDTLASVIVALGNTSAATEREIAHHATMVAQATAVYNTSSAEASALGAALASLGVRAELGGSSVGRAFRAMDAAIRGQGRELKLLADLTGRTSDEITRMFRENSVDAFQLFLQGLGQVIKDGGDAAYILKQFGLEGEEILKTLPTLAKNNELVAKSLRTARNELQNTTALETEAARAFDTLGSKMSILGNTITAVILKFRNSTGPLADFIGDVTDAIKILFGLDIQAGKASERALVLAKSIQAVTGALVAFIAVRSVAHFYTLIEACGGLTAAFRLLTATMATNPIGLIAVAISSAVAALIYFKDEVVTIGDKTMTVGDIVVATFEYLRDVGLYTFKNITDAFALLRDSFMFYVDLITKAWGELTDFLGVDWREVFDFLLNVVKKFANFVTAIFRGLIKTVGVLITTLKDAVFAFSNFDIHNPLESLGKVKDALAEALSPTKALEDIKNVWKESFNIDYVGATFDLGKRIAKGVSEGYKAYMGTVGFAEWERLFNPTKVLQGIMDRAAARKQERDSAAAQQEFVDNVTGMFEKAKNAIGGYYNSIKKLFTFGKDGGGGGGSAKTSGGLLTYIKGLKGSAEELKSLADDIGMSFGRMFEDMAFGAKNAKDAVKDLLLDIAKLIFYQQVTKPLADAISGAFFSPSKPAASAATPSYYGNVFHRGSLVPFAYGGIVDRPSWFPMSRGRIGTLAEREPEAIMPLTRTSDGRLGVRSIGRDGGSIVNVAVNVVNQSSQSVKAEQQGTRFDGEGYVVGIVLKDLNSHGPIKQTLQGLNHG